jgi:hypothetical protein
MAVFIALMSPALKLKPFYFYAFTPGHISGREAEPGSATCPIKTYKEKRDATTPSPLAAEPDTVKLVKGGGG